MEVQALSNIVSNIQFALDNGLTMVSLQGSSRSGKTYNIMIWLISEAIKSKVHISVVRKTLPSLKASAMMDFKSIMIDMGIYDSYGKMNKSEGIYTFSNGSMIEFFPTDDEQKIRGRSRDILFMNEANEIEENEYKQLRMRTRKYCIMDYNPSFSEEHWICRINKDIRTHHFISTYKDNMFLPQSIIDEIESYKETNPSLWQIYGLGQFAIIEGLVFPADKWDLIDNDRFPEWHKKRFIGIDYGYTNDPTAIVECVMQGDEMWARELCYSTGMMSEDIANILKEYNDLIKYSESADPRLLDEITAKGVQLLYPVKKTSGSVISGINMMHGYKIHVTRNSVNLIKELKNYTYMKDRFGRLMNQPLPIDRWNHCIDAIRYIVLSESAKNSMGNKDKQYSKRDLGLFL
jgi:phage terminase large subunit